MAARCKKYYYTDYEPDKILTLSKIAGEQVVSSKMRFLR